MYIKRFTFKEFVRCPKYDLYGDKNNVSIYIDGKINFYSQQIKKENLNKDIKYIEFFIDKNNKALGFKMISEKTNNSYKIQKSAYNNYYVTAMQVLRKFKLNFNKKMIFPIKYDPIYQLNYIDLNNDLNDI